jgi:two-component system NtrC family response regulator
MEKAKLLIVEDEEAIRGQMRWALGDDYEVLLAVDRMSALEKVKTDLPPLILLDLGLPPSPRGGEEGLRALVEILAFDRGAKVIILTGNQDRENALNAIGQGAFDYFLKPADIEELKTVLKRALHIASLEKESVGKDDHPGVPVFDEIIGESPSMKSVFELVRKVSATDVSVLIQGESGTGKELIARAIHRTLLSSRSIAGRSRKTFWRANSSGMKRERSRARMRKRGAGSNTPTAGPCSLTRSGNCPFSFR